MSKYDELRKLAEAATPGPWRSRQDELQRGWSKADGHDWRYGAFSTKRDANYTTSVLEGPDAHYIAAASPDVILALLDERERLREALRDARPAVKHLIGVNKTQRRLDGIELWEELRNRIDVLTDDEERRPEPWEQEAHIEYSSEAAEEVGTPANPEGVES